MKFVIIVLLCYTIASAICADEHRAKMKLKDSERGKRNLEYSISHNYPIGSNFRLERRIASGPSFQLPSRFPPYFPAGPRPYIPNGKRGRPHSVPAPPYAVQMEPLVQYSQRDPLYDTNKLPLTADGHNDLSKPDDLLTDNNHLSENIYLQNIHGPSYSHHSHEPVYYQKEPEPIIEIIIKESNVTLPPVPVPTLPPKKKEPVQVFYVKYKKNPNGHGKDSVVYDKPIPALTPHIEEPEPEPQIDYPHHEYVTAAPPPTTTIRTIIRPDSETYIGTSGIRVTFGSEHKKEKPSIDGEEESAPQPAVIFPQNNQQHHQVHQQQQGQFSQPIPERKPLTAAFPPNFNPPSNFNQHTFNPRPSQPFQNNQFRQNHHQSIRQFPNQPNSRPPTASLPPQHRPFQTQQFPPRPLSPPQVPPQSRPSFNQQPQFHQTHQQNSQIPPSHQFSQNSFPPNHQPPQNQPFPPIQFTSHSFQHNFPSSQSQKSQFSQLLNHRPQTHFPIVQQQQNTPLPHFGQKTPAQLQQQPQNNQFNQHQQQFRKNQPSQQQQQQQSFQYHHQNHLNIQHQQQINHHQHQQPLNTQQQPKQQIQQQPQQPQPLGHVIPPGGELLKSVPRYEQHISVPAEPTQITNSQGIKSQTLPQVQSQPPVNLFATSQNIQLNQQQVTSQSTQLQQFQHEQQQRNLQIQQQLKQQEQILQQQKHLSPQEFQQQIQQQFQQFPQNFAQLSHIQNKQQSQLLSLPQKQENIQIQSSVQPDNHQQNHHQQQLQQSVQQHQQQLQQSAQQLQQSAHQQHRQQQSQQQQHQQQQQQLQQQQQQLQQQTQQLHQSQAQNFFLQNLQNQQKSIQEYYQSQNNPSSVVPSSTTQNILYQSTTQKPSTTTIKTEDKSTEKKKENKLPPNIVLPDEVPDELREQLLSSGILSNADISVLDYDKVGDIPIEALPPDQLANFYGAGGAQQISASERKEIFVKLNGESIDENSKTIFNQELEAEASEVDEVTESAKSKSGVEMKVVHYDSETQEGKAVQDSYVRDDATQVDPVVLNDNKYNRYLPLKVSGVNFPIPDVPELKGRNITSVVVLAPVDYEFQAHEHHSERTVRDIEGDIKDVRLLAGEALKKLIKEPTKENYNKWLERENQTASDKQSVVLLVTGSPENKEKEIFMYDVATKSVSKLSGELSSAFVEAAENNAEDGSIPEASEIYEKVIKPKDTATDLEAENSDIVEELVNAPSALETADNKVSVRSGYSKTG